MKKEDAVCVHLLKINLLSPKPNQEKLRKTLQEKHFHCTSDFHVLRNLLRATISLELGMISEEFVFL